MSIAVSTVVKPSKLLFVLASAACLAPLSISVLVGSGLIGEISFFSRLVLIATCTTATVIGFFQLLKKRKTHRIDISGVGQIRLTVYMGVADELLHPELQTRQAVGNQPSDQIVRMLEGSTLWPHVLILNFRFESGRTCVLLVLRDSVSQEAFRKLSLACRWIAAHNFIE